jgi:hypothetical protein
LAVFAAASSVTYGRASGIAAVFTVDPSIIYNQPTATPPFQE